MTYPFNPLDAVGWHGDLSVVEWLRLQADARLPAGHSTLCLHEQPTLLAWSQLKKRLGKWDLNPGRTEEFFLPFDLLELADDDWEWYVILTLWSPLQVIRLLEDSSEQATRLRKTSPLLSLLSDSERRELIGLSFCAE